MKAWLDAPSTETPAQHLFRPQHSNKWAMMIGFLHGRGVGSTDIAAKLADGTHPATVRGVIKKAGLLPEKPRQVVVPLEMQSWQRDAVAAKAAELGIDMDALIMRVVESAIVLDDLYDAVTDGRYDGVDNRGDSARHNQTR